MRICRGVEVCVVCTVVKACGGVGQVVCVEMWGRWCGVGGVCGGVG